MTVFKRRCTFCGLRSRHLVYDGRVDMWVCSYGDIRACQERATGRMRPEGTP